MSIPNTYTQTDPTEIRDRALRGFSRAAEARAIREQRAEQAEAVRDNRRSNFRGLAHDGTSPHLNDFASDLDANRLHTFTPEMARSGRGPSRDHHRRVMHFGIAADKIISTARMADMTGPAWQREESYRAAFIAERRRGLSARLAEREAANR